jgi:single-stranded-DNA-specific exonuclease
VSIEQVSNQLQDKLSIPEVFRIYLKKRGISDGDCLKRFLFPQLTDLPKPDTMKNLLEASCLVATYMHSGRQIVVWGDYDVDGTTRDSTFS